jgi:peptidoglycan/LPS O-acetylase OafA/YrhL
MKNDLANLDILRSFAVLLVVVQHFLMYAQHGVHTRFLGLTGVCLFFVHTCLVLMWSLERDPHTGRFYLRRLFRLFPLWLVVLSLVIFLKIPTAPIAAPYWGYHAPSALELLANVTMTYNLWFGAKVVGASWSLPIEAQMYLVLPLLFFFVRSTRALWVLLVLDALVITSVWSSGIHNPLITTSLATCIPYFLPGVMAYVLIKKTRPKFPAWIFPLVLISLTLLETYFGSVFWSSFFCLVIGLSLPFFHQVTWSPITKSCHLIARYSYGIYLTHIPAICVGMHFLQGHSLPLRLSTVLVTIVVASVALYHGVEAPMIRLGGKLAKKIEPGPMPKMNEATLSLEPAP